MIFERPKLALDFGTANCVIIKQGEGIVLNEPTVVAIDKKNKKILAVGKEAKKMLGKEPENIVARRPLQNGGISNFRLAYELLQSFLNKSLGNIRVSKPDITVSIPSKLNSIEERALVKALEMYGVNTITLYPESMAAAIGAELPVHKPTANMIINMGGGTVEIGILSLNGIVKSYSHVGSGDNINSAIQDYLLKEKRLVIGEISAEKLKMKIGSAMPMDNPLEQEISGKDSATGEAKTVIINSNDIYKAIRHILNEISESVKKVLEKTNSELVMDLSENGIALSGGTAMLYNIEKYFTKSLGLPCYVVDRPLESVVRGLG